MGGLRWADCEVVARVRIMRGASWLNFPNVLRLSVRLPFAADGHTSNVGARCARDARILVVSAE